MLSKMKNAIKKSCLIWSTQCVATNHLMHTYQLNLNCTLSKSYLQLIYSKKKKSNVNLPKYIHYISICSVLNNWTCIYLCFLTIFSCLAYAIFFICMRENCVAISLSYRVGKKKSFAALFRFQYKRHSLSRVFFSVLLDSFNDWLNTNLKKFCELFFRMLPRLITFNLKCFIENKLAQKRK